MSDTNKPVIETRVARQEWGEYHFRGHRVFAELAGRRNHWNMISLGVGGPVLSPEDCQMLDDLASSTTAADPRIPALKMGRVIGSFGSEMAAFSSIFLPLEEALFGPWSAKPAAQLLVELGNRVGETYTDDDVEREIQSLLKQGQRTHGFGVPVRVSDERVWAFRDVINERGRADGRYWKLMLAADRVLSQLKGKGANLGSGYAATLLDLGFVPDQVPLMGICVVLPCVIPNALEAAQQAPEVLRKIPDQFVRYVGPDPRPSPRSQGLG